MLTELCKELNNWFDKKRLFGVFTITDGSLTIDGAQDGQYIRICDSVFNDGVYEYPVSNLKDETFDGAVWLMAVPPDVIELSKEIDAWKEQYTDILQSPYQSESFGGYSYSKASGSQTGANGVTGVTWQSTFADKLSHWRKI